MQMKNGIFKLAQLFPFKLLKKISASKIIFPFYHIVSNTPPKHIKHIYPVKTINEFKDDLDFILKYYEPIDIGFLKKILSEEKKLKKNYFLLTFDDGLKQIYTDIAPILKQKSIPAVFFINSAFVDNKNIFFRYKMSVLIDELLNDNEFLKKTENYLKSNGLFYKDVFNSLKKIKYAQRYVLDKIYLLKKKSFSDYLKHQKPYMSENEIIELSNQGFEIGAHSHTHPQYSELKLSEQINETIKSINYVKEKLKPKYSLFAFPFTDDKLDRIFFEKIFAKKNIDFTFGTAGIKKDSIKKNIQRIPMENGFSAKKTLKYEMFYYFVKSFIGKNTIKR